jgi:hypothetical protein
VAHCNEAWQFIYKRKLTRKSASAIERYVRAARFICRLVVLMFRVVVVLVFLAADDWVRTTRAPPGEARCGVDPLPN